MVRWLLLFTITVFIGNACQSSSSVDFDESQRQNSRAVFADARTAFQVHVFYEIGAEPYVGNIGLTANSTWNITKTSYEELFNTHAGRTITVPDNLAQMNALADQSRTTWNYTTLLALARQNAPALIVGGDANISVFFVNGTLGGNGNILGVQFTGYPYAFIFKDVIVGTGGTSVSQRYAEQATVVHEIGHTIGLVNHGVPMVVAHEDASHPHHSSNNNCVMYWAVESATDILGILSAAIVGNQLNLFGPESLQDSRAYHP